MLIKCLRQGQYMEYIAYLHKDRKSDFGVSFPDFPGCITAGKTLGEASRNAAEALKIHIEGMLADGDEIPEASALDDLAGDRAMKGAVVFLVRINMSDKVERFNITARKSQMEEIDRLARQQGMTRSAYLVAAAISGSGPKSGIQKLPRKLVRNAV
jgi:predicted RNase H-like HicB family nuclease